MRNEHAADSQVGPRPLVVSKQRIGCLPNPIVQKHVAPPALLHETLSDSLAELGVNGPERTLDDGADEFGVGHVPEARRDGYRFARRRSKLTQLCDHEVYDVVGIFAPAD